MAETDFKVTVIGAINEVRTKSKLSSVSTIDEDSDSLSKLKYLNDVVSEISDYGDWREQFREITVSTQTSVRDYAVSGVVIQNIHEVAASWRTSELNFVDIDEIRRLQRLGQTGRPNHWSIKKINGEGNPVITFDKWTESGDFFDIAYYQKPSVYTTADASSTVPFPGRVVVQGLLCKTILDESDGEPTQRYIANLEVYQNMLDEAFNRYNGDTGSTTYFRPSNKGK